MSSEAKIKASLSYNYNNSLHTQFNERMYGIVGKVDATLINLPATIYADWYKYIGLEMEINAEIAAKAETKEMSIIDAQRDEQVTHLFEDIRNQCRSPFANKREAANTLVLYVNALKGLQNDAADVETSRIKSLISDLRNETNAPLCAILGYDELISLLETTNNKYDELKSVRTVSRTDSQHLQSKDVRKQTDDAYNKVCKIIEVAYIISENEDDKNSILALIAEMNQYISETKTSYHQMHSAKPPKTDDEE